MGRSRMHDTRRTAAPRGPGLAHYTGYLLRRAYVRSVEHERGRLPPDIGLREIALLATLHHQGPTSQREVGELLHVNRSVMVKLVDSLEARDWVVRDRNPADRRSYAVRVTPAGVAALEAALDDLVRLDRDVTAGLDEAEHAALTKHLRSLLGGTPLLGIAPLGELTVFLLAHAHRSLRERGTAAFADLGIEPRDFGILTVVAAEQPCSRVLIASRIGVTPPAVQGAIDALVARGLIRRAENAGDRRVHALELSEDGVRCLAVARREAAELQADVTRELGDAAEAELRTLLSRLIA